MTNGIEQLWGGLGAAATLVGVALYLWVLNRLTRLRKSESAPRVQGLDDLQVSPLFAFSRWVMRRVAEPPSRVGKANRRGSTPSPQSGKRQILKSRKLVGG